MSRAIYAAHSASSRGRRHPEPAPGGRSEFQRDRDRIVHSAAFRRLEYKTQVFVNHEGDMFRTRLTHSLEVAQIARTIARALGLDEDLTEAIALAHDLGHTPFGHAGQDALNACMKPYGGFEHNLQSLRVVDKLEEKYADFDGLNLTFETREGILKHCSVANARKLGDVGKRFLDRTFPGAEAQLANLADEIAYNNHDVDDGLRAGLIDVEQLRETRLFREAHDEVIGRYQGLERRRLIHEIIRRMINHQVKDLIETSRATLARISPTDIDGIREAGEPCVLFSEPMQALNLELKRFLRKNLYVHPKVKAMTEDAGRTVTDLFSAYFNGPENARSVADYIAGMTDRFAIAEHKRLQL